MEFELWRKTFLTHLTHFQGIIRNTTDVFCMAGTTGSFKVTPPPPLRSSHGAAACHVSNLQVVGHPGEAGGHGVTSKADPGHVRSSSMGCVGRDACQNASRIKGNGLELRCDCAAQQAPAQQQVIMSDR